MDQTDEMLLKNATPMVDERGVPFASAFYPHTINCMRKAANMTNPQPCDCGGDEIPATTTVRE